VSEQNKALARRFYEEVFNKKNLKALDELCSPNFVDHNPMPGQEPGVQGIKELFNMFMGAFPDFNLKIEELVAERDLVVALTSGTGTHKGELMGAAPTGKKVTFKGIDMIRIRDGKATDVWHYGDDLMVMAQIGVKVM